MTQTKVEVSQEERLLDFVAQLEPRVPELATQMNEERQLPVGAARELAEAGLFKMFTPVEYGGLEMDPLAASRVVEKMSRLDGSLGWLPMIGSQSAWIATALPGDVAGPMLSPVDAVVAGAVKPGGSAARVEGGYRVSGSWPLSSGCTYATWFYGTCFFDDPEMPVLMEGVPPMGIVFFPAEEGTIVDSWHSNGLRGTGSHTVALQDVFIPKERVAGFAAAPGEATHQGPLYRDQLNTLVFICQAGQALGMAQAAFEAFKAMAPGKLRFASTKVLRDEPAVQARAAEAWALIHTARCWLYEVAGDVWETIVRGEAPTVAQRMSLRLAITNGITASVQAGEIIHRTAGSSLVYQDDPLGRIIQDLYTAGAHVQATPRIMEITGAFLLGKEQKLPPNLV